MLLTHATVFVDGAFHKGLDILVENGRIEKIGRDLVADGHEKVDLQGAFLTPGMIDIHIHGMAGADTMGGEAAIHTMSQALARHGVTGFLPTTVAASFQSIHHALSGVSRVADRPSGAAVLGAHLEGPFINMKNKGALDPNYIIPASMEAYREMTGEYAHLVRQITMAPDIPGALDTAKILYREGVVVSIGHTSCTYAQACEACKNGFSHVTHTFNAQTPIHHRDPGTAGAALTQDELTCEFIADLIHLHPAILYMGYKMKGPDKMVLISDAMEACGIGDGEYMLGGKKVIVKGGEARLEEGNLAGSTLTLDTAVRNMIVHVGVPAEHVIPMATSTPARHCKAADRGRIAEGLVADLCVFNPDWRLTRTLLRGEWVNPS